MLDVVAKNPANIILTVKLVGQHLPFCAYARDMLVGQDEDSSAKLDIRSASPTFAIVAMVFVNRSAIGPKKCSHALHDIGQCCFPLFFSEQQFLHHNLPLV